MRNSSASRLREVILPFCSALVKPSLECWVLSWVPQYNTDMDVLERGQQRAMRMVKELDYLTYEEQLRELKLFSLEKTISVGIIYINTKGRVQKRWSQAVFSGAQWQHQRQWAWTEAQEHPVNTRKQFFTVGLTKHWRSYSKRLWSPPPWRYSKAVWRWSWKTSSRWSYLS